MSSVTPGVIFILLLTVTFCHCGVDPITHIDGRGVVVYKITLNKALAVDVCVESGQRLLEVHTDQDVADARQLGTEHSLSDFWVNDRLHSDDSWAMIKWFKQFRKDACWILQMETLEGWKNVPCDEHHYFVCQDVEVTPVRVEVDMEYSWEPEIRYEGEWMPREDEAGGDIDSPITEPVIPEEEVVCPGNATEIIRKLEEVCEEKERIIRESPIFWLWIAVSVSVFVNICFVVCELWMLFRKKSTEDVGKKASPANFP